MKKMALILMGAAIISSAVTLWLASPIYESERVELVLVDTYEKGTTISGKNVLLRSEDINTENDRVEVYMPKFWYEKVESGYGNVSFETTEHGIEIIAEDNEAVIYVAQTSILEYLYKPKDKINEVNSRELHSPNIAYFIYY